MSPAVKLMLSPLLMAQAVATRARLPRLPEAGGARRGHPGEPVYRYCYCYCAGAIAQHIATAVWPHRPQEFHA